MKRAFWVMGVVWGLSACGGGQGDIDDEQLQTECGSEHALVDSTAAFSTLFHGVEGTVTAVDDCTLRIDNFSYDGTGLDVRLYGSPDGDFVNGIALTNDLRRTEGYDKDTLTVSLPEGITLDDVRELSVWCVTVSESFGEAAF